MPHRAPTDGGAQQGGFPWYEARPLCTQCGLRSARPHYAVGFYRTCRRCAKLLADGSYRGGARGYHRRCPGCHLRLAPQRRWCDDLACARAWRHRKREENKTAVFVALGNRCSCPGAACWHAGGCAVTERDILTVHHRHGNGAAIRGARRAGGHASREGARTWSRYRRALMLSDHGMVLLCCNCHQFVTACERRRRRA